jgi:hypothetical protein
LVALFRIAGKEDQDPRFIGHHLMKIVIGEFDHLLIQSLSIEIKEDDGARWRPLAGDPRVHPGIGNASTRVN